MTALLWALLWLLGSQDSSVTGVVVRAGTSQPLPNTVVALWPTERTVRTDEEGRFRFPNVGSGEYSLIVIHDGIKLRVPITLNAAHRSEYATLEVRPAPAIAGTVFDPNGERAAAVRVQALRTIYTPNGPRLRSMLSVLTDDLGDFRLYWLRPGEYYVAASLNDRDQRTASTGLRLTSNLSPPDDGYPTIYFGGGLSPFESAKVRLSEGTDTDGVTVFIKDGERFDLPIKLVSAESRTCARVAVVPEGGFVTETDFVSNACDSVKIKGLSPGVYVVLAINDLYASDVIRVRIVDRDPEEVPVALVRTVSISGRISNHPSPGTARVLLSRSSRDISQEIEAPFGADGRFTFPSVGPGAYDVFVDPLPENFYIGTLTYRRINIMNLPIRVDAVPPGAIEISLARSDVVVEGVAVDRGLRPAPGAEVVLVPWTGSSPRMGRYLTTTADAGGKFRVAGVPPGGTYLVFAFEDIEPGGYYAFLNNPVLLNRYAPNGQQYNSNFSSELLRLFAIPAAQTSGGIR